MDASAIFNSLNSIATPMHSLKSLSLARSRFLSSDSLLALKSQIHLSQLRITKLRTQKRRSFPLVLAAQTNFFKVIQTAWKISRDGIEAGTNMVPDSVPRPIARISVTVVGLTVVLFVLKSFLSTAFFVLATMGLVYFAFIALYKDEGSKEEGKSFTRETKTTTSDEEAMEEARRIMEKYK